MQDRKHLCHLGKASRGRIELSMIVTSYFQCLTLRIKSGHLSNALTRELLWLTEKLISPPTSHSQLLTVSHTQKYPPVTPLWANSTTVKRPLDKMKPKDWFRHISGSSYEERDIWLYDYKVPSSGPTLNQQYND